MTRPAKSSQSQLPAQPAVAQSMDPKVKTVMPAKKALRRPNKSPRRPTIGMATK
ncbi:hypothetical protein D3C78_1807620 [compost metagenome]